MIKFQPFFLPHYKLLDHKSKNHRVLSFNLIRLHLQKKIFLEKMFIFTTSQHPHQLFYS